MNKQEEYLLIYIAHKDSSFVLNAITYLVYKHLESQNIELHEFNRLATEKGESKEHDICNALYSTCVSYRMAIHNVVYNKSKGDLDAARLLGLNTLYYVVGRIGFNFITILRSLNDFENDSLVHKIKKEVTEYLNYADYNTINK